MHFVMLVKPPEQPRTCPALQSPLFASIVQGPATFVFLGRCRSEDNIAASFEGTSMQQHMFENIYCVYMCTYIYI